MATQTTPGGNIAFTTTAELADPAKDLQRAINRDARDREVQATAAGAATDAAAALATLGAVRQETSAAKTAAQQSAASSSSSAAAANAAADTAERFGDDVELLKQMAQIEPGSVTDAQTALLIQDPQTETFARLNAQTVQLAERVEFNVLDFGAAGDWNGTTGTDNLPAFNEVAGRVKASVGPSRIVIPAGDYWLSNNWLLDGENVEVQCDAATTIRTTSATLTGQTVAFMGHGVLSPNNVSAPKRERFIWRGGRIVADGSGTMDNALGVVRVKHSHVSDVSLNADRKALTAQYGIDNIVWERVTVERAGVDGVTVETACHRVALRDIHVVDATGVGVLVTSGSASARNADVVMDNVTVDKAATSYSLGLTDRVSLRAVKSLGATVRDLQVSEVADLSISADSHLPNVQYGANVTRKKPRRQSITLGAGWSSMGAPHNTPSVYVTSDGMAVLSGAIKGGTTAVGTGFGTLPVGALPAYRERFMVQNAGGSGSAAVDVYIDPSGSMIFGGAAPNNTIVSLSGITYPVA